jgi:hypothetical protein
MQQGEVPDDLRELVFSFLHKFSRFEFALKEAGKWRKGPGRAALPDWESFVAEHEATYQLTAAATALLAANPKKQVVAADEHSLEFQTVTFDADASNLARVSRLARTVRNNLFHGGKYDAEGWDNPVRIRELVPLTSAVLDEFADLAGVGADYQGAY